MVVMTRPQSSIVFLALSSDRIVSKISTQSSKNGKLNIMPNRRITQNVVKAMHFYAKTTTAAILYCVRKVCRTLTVVGTNKQKVVNLRKL